MSERAEVTQEQMAKVLEDHLCAEDIGMVVQVLTPLLADYAAKVRRETLEEAAKVYCVNCGNGIPTVSTQGGHVAHVGGLHCYSWAIRALATRVESKQTQP